MNVKHIIHNVRILIHSKPIWKSRSTNSLKTVAFCIRYELDQHAYGVTYLGLEMPRLAVHGFQTRPERNTFLDYSCVEFAAVAALENGWGTKIQNQVIDQVLGHLFGTFRSQAQSWTNFCKMIQVCWSLTRKLPNFLSSKQIRSTFARAFKSSVITGFPTTLFFRGLSFSSRTKHVVGCMSTSCLDMLWYVLYSSYIA